MPFDLSRKLRKNLKLVLPSLAEHTVKKVAHFDVLYNLAMGKNWSIEPGDVEGIPDDWCMKFDESASKGFSIFGDWTRVWLVVRDGPRELHFMYSIFNEDVNCSRLEPKELENDAAALKVRDDILDLCRREVKRCEKQHEFLNSLQPQQRTMADESTDDDEEST